MGMIFGWGGGGGAAMVADCYDGKERQRDDSERLRGFDDRRDRLTVHI